MVKITNKNRERIVEKYIDQIVDSSDMDGLIDLVVAYLQESIKEYSNEQLETEIRELYPEVLG